MNPTTNATTSACHYTTCYNANRTTNTDGCTTSTYTAVTMSYSTTITSRNTSHQEIPPQLTQNHLQLQQRNLIQVMLQTSEQTLHQTSTKGNNKSWKT
jgi:hypothetical protein